MAVSSLRHPYARVTAPAHHRIIHAIEDERQASGLAAFVALALVMANILVWAIVATGS